MSQVAPATPSTTPPPQSTPATPRPAAVVATRRRCEADGIGLSHYVLMDRKPAP